MNTLALYTWISAGVLVFGSIAVFLVFLRDARRLLEEMGEGKDDVVTPPNPER